GLIEAAPLTEAAFAKHIVPFGDIIPARGHLADIVPVFFREAPHHSLPDS
ncbi:MAG: hypothetical protein IMZ50_15385, partial [Candidatus Atribacteria bacterium]|nr:hypothetical protein [Candidatus Atribacteria bacterium]